jgi:hypothetical protein
MCSGQSHEFQNVVIVNRVEHLASGAAWTDEPHRSQQAQLVRDGGFAHADERGDIADAQLAIRKGVQDANARGIAENTKRFREDFNGLRFHQRSAPRVGAGSIEVRSIARRIGNLPRLPGNRDSGHVNI